MFSEISGLKVNFDKTKVILTGSLKYINQLRQNGN
jgi:hypothetical protein